VLVADYRDRLMLEDRRCRVLLVEDNEVNQALAVAIMAKLGYGADVASDGREAVAALADAAYGAVLMDCQLPVMDGYQATAEIRRHEGTGRHTPIIAMTADALPGDRERCLAVGMDDYIAKPVLVADVQAVLSRWLGAEVTTPTVAGSAHWVESAAEVLDPDRLAELGELDSPGNRSLVGRLAECFLARGPPISLTFAPPSSGGMRPPWPKSHTASRAPPQPSGALAWSTSARNSRRLPGLARCHRPTTSFGVWSRSSTA
jgi:CheY-like chemotaxis protein